MKSKNNLSYMHVHRIVSTLNQDADREERPPARQICRNTFLRSFPLRIAIMMHTLSVDPFSAAAILVQSTDSNRIQNFTFRSRDQ